MTLRDLETALYAALLLSIPAVMLGLALALLTGCTPDQLKSDYRYADCCLPDSGTDAGCEWRAVAYRTYRGLEPLASEDRVCADTGLEAYR